MEVLRRVSDHVRKTATLGLGQSGPWNLAMHLRGAETLLMDTAMDPEFVHALMKYTTEVVRAMGDGLIDAGFAPSLGEATASCSLISPQIYRDFIKPYHAELCTYFKTKRIPISIHICGYIDPILDEVLDTGIRFISLDAPSSLQKLVNLSEGKVTIMGNVPTALFADGTKEEMEEAVRACVDIAGEGSGYILSSGCEIPLNSTEDRVEHYFQCAHQFGRDFMANLRERSPELFEE
jgi:uroporphyrinogen decarboxylase